jgi:hypothetical protein
LNQRRQAAGRYNALRAHRGDDDPETVAAAQELKAVTLADQIQRAVDSFPPLTEAQRCDIVARLVPTSDQEAA